MDGHVERVLEGECRPVCEQDLEPAGSGWGTFLTLPPETSQVQGEITGRVPLGSGRGGEEQVVQRPGPGFTA